MKTDKHSWAESLWPGGQVTTVLYFYSRLFKKCCVYYTTPRYHICTVFTSTWNATDMQKRQILHRKVDVYYENVPPATCLQTADSTIKVDAAGLDVRLTNWSLPVVADINRLMVTNVACITSQNLYTFFLMENYILIGCWQTRWK